MSDIAVSVEGLGKRYRISHRNDPYGRLTETLADAMRSPFDRLRGRPRETTEWFWALQDVSFEVRYGEVLGVIGRNGAGKSTLLKILSRITEPTTGSARLDGRVGALLEVGTGFHPELTGRENIYLSGAVLGMRRHEIVRRFDAIVDFAGIEQFLDTPIKRYSSGMQVRLGFAIAAHLEPEILFVDEVLAVGDAEFQAKCLGRMEEIGASGKAIIFVSHSSAAILRLCTRGILIERGRVVADGAATFVMDQYLRRGLDSIGARTWESGTSPGDDVAQLLAVRVVPVGGGSPEDIDIRQPIDIQVDYRSVLVDDLKPTVNVHLFNDAGINVFVNCDWNNRDWWRSERTPGTYRATCRIPGNFLAEGRFTIDAVISTFDPLVVHAREEAAVSMIVVDRSHGDGVRGPFTRDWPGVVRPMLEWTVDRLPDPAIIRGE